MSTDEADRTNADAEPAARNVLFVLFGPLVWFVHLFLVYGAHASVCAAGDRLPLNAAALRWLIGGASVAAILVLGLALIRPRLIRRLIGGGAQLEEENRFISQLMRFLTGLALLAVIGSSVATVVVPLCAQLR